MVQERPVRVERRLAAILAADVAGYSRLMHHDEEGTHAKVTALLADEIAPAISDHSGRIVKNTGDGFLAEFSSAVLAVRAAIQFQTRVKELTVGDAEDKRIAFRVGINVGDVIVEPHDIFGDGVNIAARLESIAEPGGICISSAAYDQVRGKVGVEFADQGAQNLKNITRPVRAYTFVRDIPSSAIQDEPASAGSFSPPRLSIVVLPFTNLSGDPEQEYFVDGVTEGLTTDLSRMSGSFVIGRHTAFTYKGKAIDLKQIGRELNIRYVLEGSVQRSGNRLRVNVQLVDAETASQVWAERFDKPVADLFDMQDEIVSRLANSLNTQLIEAEARRAERAPHPNSLDLYFQGIACFNKGPTPEHAARARSFFERALALDPGNVEALVGTALVAIGANYLSDDRAGLLAAAETALIKALSLAPQHAQAHMQLGVVKIFTGHPKQGIAECGRALELDRNLADAHGWIGLGKIYMGQANEAEAHIKEAFRLSPRDTHSHRWMMIIGFAKLWDDAFADAVVWLRRGIEANPNSTIIYFVLAATLALLGKLDEARAIAQAGLAINPTFTIRRFRTLPSGDSSTYRAKRERIYDGMRMAGVPEG
jgi:TolB-like protein/class 3 adenylate cyclase/Flp pilus assembly protein TadD